MIETPESLRFYFVTVMKLQHIGNLVKSPGLKYHLDNPTQISEIFELTIF